jgi:hypothetical protein
MRKSEVFAITARYADAAERPRFRERAEFFFHASTTQLAAHKTRTLARPVIILLSNGWRHAYLQRHPDDAAPPPECPSGTDFGRPEVFVPQKVRAKRRFRALAAAAALCGIAFLFWLLLR